MKNILKLFLSFHSIPFPPPKQGLSARRRRKATATTPPPPLVYTTTSEKYSVYFEVKYATVLQATERNHSPNRGEFNSSPTVGMRLKAISNPTWRLICCMLDGGNRKQQIESAENEFRKLH